MLYSFYWSYAPFLLFDSHRFNYESDGFTSIIEWKRESRCYDSRLFVPYHCFLMNFYKIPRNRRHKNEKGDMERLARRNEIKKRREWIWSPGGQNDAGWKYKGDTRRVKKEK